MFKKAIILLLMFCYLYALAYNIFLNSSIRIPSPILFGLPIILLFWQKGQQFLYLKEALVLLVANFLYDVVAQEDLLAFSVDSIVIVISLFYFNFFVGADKQRFNWSIMFFFSLLAFSAIIMLLNHMYPAEILKLRGRLIGGEIAQSPSGITPFIFKFGYQIAALTAFLFTFSMIYSRFWVVKVSVLIICLIIILFGMQRSALVTFAISGFLFLLLYYKFKAIPIIVTVALISALFSMFIMTSSSSNKYDNIFAKNERNAEEDRGNLVAENLNIIASYPFGLMFYGKSWGDVIKNNRVYVNGITSHNAYLMFITFLGPFVGIGFLVAIYYRLGGIFKDVLFDIRNHKNSMLICLCISFLSVSLNALFHNDWLLSGNGPTIFLYFAILQRNYIKITDEELLTEHEIDIVKAK